MNVDYIVQPELQFGRILFELFAEKPIQAIFVSAFVSLQTIMRIKEEVIASRESASEILFVLGIDLGGTSKEVLEEILSWNIDVRIIKNRIPGHIFHPKLYLFKWEHKAKIIIGSNNITEGGFFGNYECATCITYELPNDLEQFNSACAMLNRFIRPEGQIVYNLTEEFLKKLIARGEVPSEDEIRRNKNLSAKKYRKKQKISAEDGQIFGVENIDPPPPIPAELLKQLVKHIRHHRKKRKEMSKGAAISAQPPIDDKANDILLPTAFYMTLPTLQGNNIPGEARIPLEAIELAKKFWGWPDEYTRDVSPRAGKQRVYWNWRPRWRIWSVENPKNVNIQEVRMYMYENSSDFRFYARPLVNAGGDLGDVIRIRRIAQVDAEYECVLARRGTPEYSQWIRYCTQPVRNSTRRFGYA